MVREDLGATDWPSLQERRSSQVAGLCMFIWDEMVHRGVVSDPSKISPIIDRGFKGTVQFITRELGEEPVKDAYAVSYFNEIDRENSFVDVSLVRCWPSDIHIADVEFSDNRKPVHSDERVKSAAARNYHGLPVFGEFVSRLGKVASERGVERISLMVARPDLHDVFTRHGFRVSDTAMAKLAYERVGAGYPMLLAV